MEKVNYILFFLFLNFYPAFTLYADQIGKFDWLQRYIGPVEKIVFDPSSSPSRRVIVSTSQNVLAALSTKSGDIIWRHLLETNEAAKIESLVANDQLVTVLTGNLLRTFDVVNAALTEEVSLDINPAWLGINKKLFTFGNNVGSVFRVHILEQDVQIISFDAMSGEVESTRTLKAPWIRPETKCLTAGEVIVCLDLNSKSMYSAKFTGNDSFMSSPLKTFGFDDVSVDSQSHLEAVGGSAAHLVVKIGSKKKLLHIHGDGIHSLKDVSDVQSVFMTDDMLFLLTQSMQSVSVQASDLSNGNEITELGIQTSLPAQSGVVETFSVYKFERNDGGTSLRVMLSCSDHSLHYIASGGIIWTREEAMSEIVSAEAIDLPMAGAAESYHDQLSYKAGLLSSFIHRFKTQLAQIVSLKDFVFSSSNDFDTDTLKMERDQFNLHKLVVVVTKSGKVFGIDSLTGKAIWSTFLPMFSTFAEDKVLVFEQRSSSHFPMLPQCVVVCKHKITGKGLLFTFNPLTGERIGQNGGIEKLDYAILQASMLQQNDLDYIKPLLLISDDMKAHAMPASGESVINEWKNSIYIYLTKQNSSTLTGYTLRHSRPGALVLTEVWALDLTKNGVINGIYGKRGSEQIHSPGRVLADRSVLYKYGNPNLVVVTTYGTDAVNKNMLTVHLVDTVTGNILESVCHKRVSGPFHFVHSENWVIYTVYNEKFRRNEITTLELFEGLQQANATSFSSFGARSTPPIVERQAFILPQGIQAASHTTTEKGITTKFLLFALNSGNILQVSKWFLDPRRPISHGGPHEEGLVPYMPEIPLHPQEMINYNKSLPRVKAIYTAPTGLESTCLVFAYGLDVYYTRVFPSKMFDVLKDDFDHYLIIGVLFCLISASFITRKLSQKKALKQAWK